ncbi:MAG TPA: hydrogen peroxide-inducible genes activator [Bacteroidales bacterium]
MTVQQLEYIVAVNKYRHFVTASEQCGVTQPTLSLMIQKLESELNVSIFDRSKYPIEPTTMGLRLIHQAEITLREMRKMKEMVISETESLSGPLKLGVIPTLAPYLVPEFIHEFKANYPQIQLSISEMRTATLIEALQKDSVDMFIAATPLEQPDFYEIPLYYEKFVAYFAPDNPYRDTPLSAQNMPRENLWILQEGHCFRSQLFNFCQNSVEFNHAYEAGSIETLIRIVDKNGGYSVIPELHLSFLTEEQKANIRNIDYPPAVREISIVIRKDFIKERLINAVANTIKSVMPENMLDERLKKFSIKL